MTKDQAETLAKKIQSYWEQRGCAVTVVTERMAYDPHLRAVRYEIRSDLVNGLCPNCAAPVSKAA